MVSAWGTVNRVVLGQRKTEEKSTEITAIPGLLKFLYMEYEFSLRRLTDFDGQKLIDSFQGLLEVWDFRIYESLLDEPTVAQLNQGALDPARTMASNVRLAFIEDPLPPATFGAGVGLFLLPETTSAKPGIALLPYASQGFSISRSASGRRTAWASWWMPVSSKAAATYISTS